MAKFTTRVELLNALSEDYNVLHREMQNRNFTRTITDSDNLNLSYHLPTAEYNRDGEYTKAQTLDAAIAAANVTGRASRILVTESAGRTWHNLQRV